MRRHCPPAAATAALILAMILGSAPLCAQRYNFKFYGEDQGLQNLAVQVALQDQTGFLWVGTQNGLYRYDGSRFTAFGRNEGLPSSRIESLHESVEGTLWVGTRTGLGRHKGEGFETVPLRLAQGIVGREGIASNAAGQIYLATNHGLITGRISSGPMQFTPVGEGQASGEATSVYADAHGTVWYGWGDSLFQIERGAVREAGPESGLPHEKWDAILEDLDGNLWVRSAQSLYIRPKGARRFQARTGIAEATNTFPTLALDPSGRLLVPTNLGLARQTDRGWQIVDAQAGLTTNDISAVVQDREGSIWLGLFGSGLARWLGYNEWQSWSDHEGLSRESVWSIARDTGGRLWIGTQFGLNFGKEPSGDDRDGRLVWERRPIPGVDMIRALAAGKDGTLWIGGDPGGLLLLDPGSNPRAGSLRHFGPEQGIGANNVRHLMVDHRGRVWVSTRRGLFRGQQAKGTGGRDGNWRFEQLHPAGTLPSEGFLMTAEDAQGNVWVCGDLGLARAAGDRKSAGDEPSDEHGDQQWTRFTTKDGLKADMVAQVLAETDGSVWVGYRDAFGISHLSFDSAAGADLGRPRIEHIMSATGLSAFPTGDNALHSDKTVFLGFDSRHWLWVGTDHGVDVFDRTRWRHYGRSEGLIWDDCNSSAFYGGLGGNLPDGRVPDSSVWIGTSRGLSRFSPQSVPAPGVPPPVVFTSVKFGDRLLSPDSLLDLPYQDRSLQVRFAALTFAQESGVLYRYRILGVEPKWLETNERVLNYPKLLPGRFTLEVMARNAQGVWSAEPARLTFQILTPWWLSWWFRVASSIAAVAIFFLTWQRRTHRQEAERFRLEAAVVERTRELSLEKARVLEEKARAEQENIVVQRQKFEIERLLQEAQQASRFKSEFLANMSHEIRTPMNGILGMTDLALSMPLTAEQRDYMEAARFSADSLLILLNDILDFSKIEAGRLDLNPIPFGVRQCLDQAGKMFAVPLEAKKLAFSTHVAENVPAAVLGDPDRLRQILLNLLGNAIKFTAAGSIHVSVWREAAEDSTDLLHFSVTDTGIGIAADKKDLIFEAFRQADGSMTRKYGGTGLGLTICSRLVELMGGAIGVNSAPNRGSTFHFTARFGRTDQDAQNKTTGLRGLAGAVNHDANHDVNGAVNGAMPLSERSLTILLAEDHIVNQRLATRLLEKRGHRVTVAGSGREALALLECQSFDVILMDVQMPDMDGLETTAHIRESQAAAGVRTPIIALTAHSMKGDRERCLAAGMDQYIAKPIDPTELIMAVEAAGATALEPEAVPDQVPEQPVPEQVVEAG